MVKVYEELEFELEEVLTERTREVMSLFEDIEREGAIEMSRCGSSEELAEWVGVEGVLEDRAWGLDWLWGLDEYAWHETYLDGEPEEEPERNWEVWSDTDDDEPEEDRWDDREFVSEEEAERLFMEELDDTRWANRMRTTRTRVELIDALEHLDRWDVRVDVSLGEAFELEELVVTSLSGAWDSYEVRWRAGEGFEPLS